MALSAFFAHIDGKSIITNCQRLKFKESDRIASTLAMLEAFGVKSYEENGDIVIFGAKNFKKATIETYNDHRIAMAAAIFSQNASDETIIKNAECVNKSYPEFFKHLESLRLY